MERRTISIPASFMIDHAERDLPTPKVVAPLRNGFAIDRDDPNLPELINDAEYYADPNGPREGCADVVRAAKKLLQVLRDQGVR